MFIASAFINLFLNSRYVQKKLIKLFSIQMRINEFLSVITNLLIISKMQKYTISVLQKSSSIFFRGKVFCSNIVLMTHWYNILVIYSYTYK